MVSDWWCHLGKHLGRNASNYFMYQLAASMRSPLPLQKHINGLQNVQYPEGMLVLWWDYNV